MNCIYAECSHTSMPVAMIDHYLIGHPHSDVAFVIKSKIGEAKVLAETATKVALAAKLEKGERL